MKTTTKLLLAIFICLYVIFFSLRASQPDEKTPEEIKGYSEASYKGLVDNKKIIKIGNALIIDKKEDPYMKMLFDKFNINAKFREMVFMF